MKTVRLPNTVLLLVVIACELAAQQYQAVKQRLTAVIESEIAQKDIAAAYIAIVDNQSLEWKGAFGFSDPQRKIPASPNQVFRIASVSKLFTDIAVMQLVERGVLDLDAPVTRYVPDFHPQNTFDTPITLRQIMSHHGGIVREPPVGNYMDPTEPSLRQTIESLNQTSVVYKPGTRFKYSNAGIALAGFVVETMEGKPFAEYVEEAVFRPLGLRESSFLPHHDLLTRKPRAQLWTYDGRVMDVPEFQFGMAPAANMYSTLDDLGTFMISLFEGGKTPRGHIVTEKTLEEMWTPQFSAPGQTTGVGLGFFIDSLAGERVVSHSGDVYGFATEFAAMPGRNIGVIVVNTMNACNDWSSRIAHYTLRLILAAKQRAPLPDFPSSNQVDPVLADQVSGLYQKGSLRARLFRRGEQLLFEDRTMRSVVRQRGAVLVVDDKLNSGIIITPLGARIVIDADTLARISDKKPDPPPDRWQGLIGEYGWDHSVLYIRERDGILHAQIEWYFSYPLTELSPNTFAFPDYGLYQGERIVFQRDAKGRATLATTANIRFVRRATGTNSGETFRITPQRPIHDLRAMAIKAVPPEEEGKFLPSDLVDLPSLDSTIKLDIRYATTNNFMGTVFYAEARALLQRPAASALVRASAWLKEYGYGLLVYDAYRPWYVTTMFWEATPAAQRDFVADPSKGSRHNRGCAVDIGLYDLRTGRPVPMVSGYDEFSVRAYPDYPGGTSLERWNRELLRTALEREGFAVYEYEWWHFDFKDWRRYRIMNVPFDRIPGSSSR